MKREFLLTTLATLLTITTISGCGSARAINESAGNTESVQDTEIVYETETTTEYGTEEAAVTEMLENESSEEEFSGDEGDGDMELGTLEDIKDTGFYRISPDQKYYYYFCYEDNELASLIKMKYLDTGATDTIEFYFIEAPLSEVRDNCYIFTSDDGDEFAISIYNNSYINITGYDVDDSLGTDMMGDYLTYTALEDSLKELHDTATSVNQDTESGTEFSGDVIDNNSSYYISYTESTASCYVYDMCHNPSCVTLTDLVQFSLENVSYYADGCVEDVQSVDSIYVTPLNYIISFRVKYTTGDIETVAVTSYVNNSTIYLKNN